MDCVQPEGHARREQRSHERRIERSDRVFENAMKMTPKIWLRVWLQHLHFLSSLCLRRRRTCLASAGRTSPPPTACPITTSSAFSWTETASGRARRTALASTKNGTWKVFRPADGLAHQAVLSLALDKRTGDMWVGTMGGLSRISAGRIRQLHSAEFRPEQRHRLRSRRAGRFRLDRNRRRSEPPQYPYRPMGAV